VICGKCKGQHATAAEVRQCYAAAVEERDSGAAERNAIAAFGRKVVAPLDPVTKERKRLQRLVL
jgi:uncharacterized protein YcaQ